MDITCNYYNINSNEMLKNYGYAYIKSTLRIPTNVSNMPVKMKKKIMFCQQHLIFTNMLFTVPALK